jgi:hypothetical protein
MSVSKSGVQSGAIAERRTIDYIPDAERHGGLLSQFTLWLAAKSSDHRDRYRRTCGRPRRRRVLVPFDPACPADVFSEVMTGLLGAAG